MALTNILNITKVFLCRIQVHYNEVQQYWSFLAISCLVVNALTVLTLVVCQLMIIAAT